MTTKAERIKQIVSATGTSRTLVSDLVKAGWINIDDGPAIITGHAFTRMTTAQRRKAAHLAEVEEACEKLRKELTFTYPPRKVIRHALVLLNGSAWNSEDVRETVRQSVVNALERALREETNADPDES